MLIEPPSPAPLVLASIRPPDATVRLSPVIVTLPALPLPVVSAVTRPSSSICICPALIWTFPPCPVPAVVVEMRLLVPETSRESAALSAPENPWTVMLPALPALAWVLAEFVVICPPLLRSSVPRLSVSAPA